MNDRKSPAVTVLLCTCDRPGMLRDALAFVRQQTARAAIARVVVSENSLNDESSEICSAFSDLPLVYLRQRPPVPPLLHVKAIWGLVETPLVAILHDDDWWAPPHLESALVALGSDKRCVAAYSSFLESRDPRGYAWFNHCYYLIWMAAGGDFSEPILFLDPPGVMSACLLNASLHYSTLVGRAEAMWDAFSRNIARGNSFDNDRTFPVFLSQHGPVAYVTAPNVFVRQHPFRHAWSDEHLKAGHMKIAHQTTRYLRENFPDEVALAAESFRRVIAKLTPNEAAAIWPVLRNSISEPQWSTLIRECDVDLPALKKLRPRGILPRWANDLAYAVCPPVLMKWALWIRIGGGWEQQIRKWQRESATTESREVPACAEGQGTDAAALETTGSDRNERSASLAKTGSSGLE